MIKNKTKLLIGATTLALSIVGTLISPMNVEAIGGVGGGGGSKLSDVSGYNGLVKEFNGYAPQQQWYSERGGGKVFKQLYGGFVWYSPVPPRNMRDLTAIRSYGQNYENSHYDKNKAVFRNYGVPYNDSSNKVKLSGQTYNEVDPYKGKTGEWRYMAYSGFGDVISNPFFPSDYANDYTYGSYPYDLSPWQYTHFIKGGKSVWDNPKREDEFGLKISTLRQLIEDEPTMKAKSSDPYYWSNRLSLRTDPSDVSAIFAGTRNKGKYYRAVSMKKEARNLRIVEFTVRDHDDKLMGTFTRQEGEDKGLPYAPEKLIAGSSYKVSIKVKNNTSLDTTLNPAKVNVGYTTGENAYSNVADYSDANVKGVVSSSPTIKSGETREFPIYYFTVPDDANGYIRLHGLIHNDHYVVEDNMNPNDDNASLIFGVKNNGADLIADNVTLIDKNGKVSKDIIPGEDYKIKYSSHYKGNRIWRFKATGYDAYGNASGEWYEPEFNIPIYGTYTRMLPGGGKEAKAVNLVKNSVKLYPNQAFEYETDYITLEAPVLETSVMIDPSTYYQGINWKLDNDTWNKNWKDFYDISVSNVRVVPKTDRPVKPGQMTYGVIYDAKLTAPNYASKYEKDVAVSVQINGQLYTFVDHLRAGENKNITKEVTVPIDPTKDKEVVATVYENFDKYVWEEDLLTQGNNKAYAKAQIMPPTNPSNGACQLGGVNTTNAWTQNYNIHKWTGTLKSYTANGKTYNFYQYLPGATYNQSVSQNESYKINKVLFRSKLTEDLKLGANKDGWVDIAKGEKGKIKAGYGYELKVEVEYKTNAFTSEPSVWANGGQGQWVRPQNVKPNIPDEIYLKTPDGKILSVSGIYGTNQGLVVSKTGDKNRTVWTYSIKAKDTLGIKQTPKIYIDPNTKDGIYNLQIFTPEINGIPTKPFEKNLCDNKNLQIEVTGSNTDDLNSHIVQ